MDQTIRFCLDAHQRGACLNICFGFAPLIAMDCGGQLYAKSWLGQMRLGSFLFNAQPIKAYWRNAYGLVTFHRQLNVSFWPAAAFVQAPFGQKWSFDNAPTLDQIRTTGCPG